MLSRVQSLEQLYILKELPKDKLYADQKAMAEINRLEEISINKNPSPWNTDGQSGIKIVFFNVQSMKNKFRMIATDQHLLKGDILLMSENMVG